MKSSEQAIRDRLGILLSGVCLLQCVATPFLLALSPTLAHFRPGAYSNLRGCLAENLNTNGGTISLQSSADRFDGNGVGCALNAGVSVSPAAPANGNVLTFEARGSTFQDNRGALAPGSPPGGIIATGGLRGVAGNSASNNRLEIALWGTRISGNQGPDINAWGARSLSAALAGTGNVVAIELHGVSQQANVSAIPSVPLDPASTNTVTVLR